MEEGEGITLGERMENAEGEALKDATTGTIGGVVGTLIGYVFITTIAAPYGPILGFISVLGGGLLGFYLGPAPKVPVMGVTHDHDGASAPGGPVELGRERTR